MFKGYTKAYRIVFNDVSEAYTLKIENGQKAILETGKADKSDVTITMSTNTLIGIMEKRINPMTAYSMRKVTSIGSMNDLLKLQKFLYGIIQ